MGAKEQSHQMCPEGEKKVLQIISESTDVSPFLELWYNTHVTTWGFPGGSDSKESACNAGDLGSIPELGRSPGGECGNPLQYPSLENPHGQRSQRASL